MPDFIPSEGFDTSQERDWAATLGVLDWDKTSVVFTKRDLVEFLRHVGVTVDTDWRNISRLPRYASIGRFDGPLPAADEKKDTASASLVPESNSPPVQAAGGFKPSRRVRTAPGGPTTINLFGEDDEASTFPPSKVALPAATVTEPPTSDDLESTVSQLSLEEVDKHSSSGATFKPSRRVREKPGGQDSISQLFSGDVEDELEMMKPSRRVRTAPGGESSGIFS